MKKGTLIRVVASDPAHQGAIDHIIGNIYGVLQYFPDTGSVQVDAPEFGGVIILDKTEYEIKREP